MSDQEEDNTEEEPLAILTLFRTRLYPQVKATSQSLAGLYQSLKCPICQSLMVEPVYLRCSHRFCKECVQKSLRMQGNNGNCPTCRAKVGTKRELRQDFQIASVIRMAFGPPQTFRKLVESAQNKQIEKMGLLKSVNTLKRSRPSSLEQKQRELQLESLVISKPLFINTNAAVQAPLPWTQPLNIPSSPLTPLPIVPPILPPIVPSVTVPMPLNHIPPKRRKPQPPQQIQVESKSQSEQLKNQRHIDDLIFSAMPIKKNEIMSLVEPFPIKKSLSSASKMNHPPIPLSFNPPTLTHSHSLTEPVIYAKVQTGWGTIYRNHQPVPQRPKESLQSNNSSSNIKIKYQPVEQTIVIENDPVKQTQNKLKSFFGENYIQTLQEVYGVQINISFKKYPADYFLKDMERPGLRTFTRATVGSLLKYVARAVGIQSHQSLVDSLEIGLLDQNASFIKLQNKDEKLLDLNSKYWRGVASDDLQVFSMRDMLQSLRNQNSSNPAVSAAVPTSIARSKKQHQPQQRVLYYRLNKQIC